MFTSLWLFLTQYPGKIKASIKKQERWGWVQLLIVFGLLLWFVNHFWLQTFWIDFLLWLAFPLALVLFVTLGSMPVLERGRLFYTPMNSFYLFEILCFFSIVYRLTQFQANAYDEIYLFLLGLGLQIIFSLIHRRINRQLYFSYSYLLFIMIWILGFLYYSLAITIA